MEILREENTFANGRPVIVSTLVNASPQDEDSLRLQALEHVLGFRPEVGVLDQLREVRVSSRKDWVSLADYGVSYRSNKPGERDRRRWEFFKSNTAGADLFFINRKYNNSTAVITYK